MCDACMEIQAEMYEEEAEFLELEKAALTNRAVAAEEKFEALVRLMRMGLSTEDILTILDAK